MRSSADGPWRRRPSTAIRWSSSGRTRPARSPKDLNTDAAMLEVLPDYDRGYDPEAPLRTVVIAHIFYVEMTDEMLDRADTLPGTTTWSSRLPTLNAPVRSRRPSPAVATGGVPSTSAWSPRTTGATRAHSSSNAAMSCSVTTMTWSSRSTEEDAAGRLQRRTALQGAAVRQPAEQPGLHRQSGVVVPEGARPRDGLPAHDPHRLPHPRARLVGQQGGRRGHRRAAGDLRAPGRYLPARSVRIDVRRSSPGAAAFDLASVDVRAVRRCGGLQGWGLAHILERIPAYAAGELGYHVRTVSTTEYMSISHSSLEFKLDEMSVTTPGYAYEQIELIRLAGFVGTGSRSDFARMYMRVNFPGTGARVREIMASDTLAGKVARAVRRPRAAIRRILGR